MIEYIVIGVLALSIPFVFRYAQKRGIKKGADDFFKLLVVFGFDSKVKAFQTLNTLSTPGGIVFLGDSITQDYPVHEFYHGFPVVNRGIGGDTTEGVLKRLDVSVFALKPKKVVLLIGTNDFALLDATPEMVAANIERIVTLIKVQNEETQIVLCSIFPVNPTIDPFTVGKRTNALITRTNQILKHLQHVQYVDLYALLADADGHLKADLSHDGLHVNMIGYQIITEALKSLL